jgi:hypothetical protein
MRHLLLTAQPYQYADLACFQLSVAGDDEPVIDANL